MSEELDWVIASGGSMLAIGLGVGAGVLRDRRRRLHGWRTDEAARFQARAPLAYAVSARRL